MKRAGIFKEGKDTKGIYHLVLTDMGDNRSLDSETFKSIWTTHMFAVYLRISFDWYDVTSPAARTL